MVTAPRAKPAPAEYLLYYAIDGMGIFDTASPYYRTDLKRNYFTLSFGYKF